MTRSIDALSEEHTPILRALDVMGAMCRLARTGQALPSEHARALVDFFRTFVDLAHHSKEESILFPALVRAGILSYNEQVRTVLLAHSRGQSLMEGLDDAVRRGDSALFVEFAQPLLELMTDHIAAEDNILFPAARQFLKPKEDARIMEEYERAEADIGREKLDKLRSTIEDLAKEYCAPSDAERPELR